MTIIYVTKRYANDSGVDSNDDRRRRIAISATSSIDFSFFEGVEGALVRRRTDVLPSKFCTVSIYICYQDAIYISKQILCKVFFKKV